MVRLWVLCVIGLLAWHTSHAQPRAHTDRMTQDRLNTVRRALVDRIHIDDDTIRDTQFPNTTLSDFDRDRDGEFYTASAGWGLYDYHRAVAQFIHDNVDNDGDGLDGFVELECEAAGGPRLDPNQQETTPGTPDGDVDCDNDGVSNTVEVMLGLDPLDGSDVGRDSDHDGVSDADEIVAGTRYTPVIMLTESQSAEPSELVVAFVLDRQPGEAEPALGAFYLNFDKTRLAYGSAALGEAAVAATGKRVFGSEFGGDGTVRATITSTNAATIGSGVLVYITFDIIGDGPYAFTIDTAETSLSPPAARDPLTYGIGHPTEPLIIGGPGQ